MVVSPKSCFTNNGGVLCSSLFTSLLMLMLVVSMMIGDSTAFVGPSPALTLTRYPTLSPPRVRHRETTHQPCRMPLNHNNIICHRQTQINNRRLPIKTSTTTTTQRQLSPNNNIIPTESVTTLVASLFQSTVGTGVPFPQAFGINALGFLILQKPLSKMLTGPGLWHALFLGTMLWTCLGWKGWSVCVAYLFLGVAVTKVKFQEKEQMGIAEKRGGKRGPENLWGSAATGLLCAICSQQAAPSFLGIDSNLFLLAYVASLATKLADTFASEIGKAYGKTTFLITTFERVEPGTEGAISAEGTAAAIVGGLLLSLYGWSVGMISVPGIVISTVAAFLATNAESLLGATVQEKEGLKWMTNEVINFLNTLIGAALAIVGGKLFL